MNPLRQLGTDIRHAGEHPLGSVLAPQPFQHGQPAVVGQVRQRVCDRAPDGRQLHQGVEALGRRQFDDGDFQRPNRIGGIPVGSDAIRIGAVDFQQFGDFL